MAGQYYTGTLLASPIVRGSSGDTYGTHHSVLGVGGYMEVGTLAERNALPVDTVNGIYYDGLSSGQRRLGMLVHVYEDNIIYHLQPSVAYSIWTGYTTGQKLAALSDNNNWQIFLTSGGTSATGENIGKSFYQTTHGFIIGDVIGYDGSDYVKVNTTTANTIEPLGIVSKVIDLNNFTLTYAGYVSTSGILDYSGNTLSGGTIYYLSNITGKLSPTAPTTLNEVSKPMLVTLLSGNTGVVLQYRGFTKIDEGVDYGTFTGYTATTQIFLDKTVTGGTNIGFFSGKTGIQTIDILTSNVAYNGQYTSLYNNYYRDSNGYIRLGSPIYNGPLRRGYLSNFSPKKSWIYNTYTGLSNQIGWILVDGDISTSVGTFLSANNITANAGTPAFSQTEWWSTGSNTGTTGGTGYYYNSAIALDVNGSTYTGSTNIIGGPVYSDKQYQELRFRTIMTSTPNILKVTYDDNFVYVSGATVSLSGVSNAANVGSGVGVFKDKVNNILNFKTLIGSGSTIISSGTGNTITIYSTGGTDSATYNLSSPSAIPLGGICAGTTLTGKTSFELFEMLLVPELCGTITAPSTSIGLSASGLYEIGCILSQTVTGTFSRGSINPQYCSVSAFRSGCANAYCFIGCGMPSGLQTCTSSSASQINPTYTVSAGTQSWGTYTRYNAGSPALGSKGTQYCAALSSGCTTTSSSCIIGAYPLFATSSGITYLTKQTLVNMSTANNIQINLVAESTPNKQKFEIPCAWLSAPRPLVGVCQWNTVSSDWEYPGGSAACSLNLWTTSSSSETIQGNSIGYCRYTYNGVDRSSVCIRLVF